MEAVAMYANARGSVPYVRGRPWGPGDGDLSGALHLAAMAAHGGVGALSMTA